MRISRICRVPIASHRAYIYIYIVESVGLMYFPIYYILWGGVARGAYTSAPCECLSACVWMSPVIWSDCDRRDTSLSAERGEHHPSGNKWCGDPADWLDWWHWCRAAADLSGVSRSRFVKTWLWSVEWEYRHCGFCHSAEAVIFCILLLRSAKSVCFAHQLNKKDARCADISFF